MRRKENTRKHTVMKLECRGGLSEYQSTPGCSPPSRWALPATVLHVTIMVAAGDVIPALALVWLFCSVYYDGT